VELRRAILLFAIVLGMAAVVTAVSRPPVEEGREPSRPPPTTSTTPATTTPATPSAEPRPSGAPVEIALEADLRSETRLLPAGRAAVLTVVAYEPGQVEIPELGLNRFAEPAAPARFDLFVERPDRYAVRFIPTDTGKSRRVGVLEVQG